MERRGVFAGLFLPELAIDVHLGDGFDGLRGLLVREVIGLVFLLDLYLIVGLDGGELRESAFVAPVGFEPEGRADGKRIVVDRNSDDGNSRRTDKASAAHLVGVIESIVADADVDVRDAAVGRVTVHEGAEG
jgi:hypothetical protein